MNPTTTEQRTFVVLFGPQGPALFHDEISTIVTKEYGFSIIQEKSVVAEELEEAGIFGLDLEGGGEHDEMSHCAVVLERVDAVRVWKELAGVGHLRALNRNS